MDIKEAYNLVFKDMIECYIEGMHENDKIFLTDEEIQGIVYKMIYKEIYLWNCINETIDFYISKLMKEKEGN